MGRKSALYIVRCYTHYLTDLWHWLLPRDTGPEESLQGLYLLANGAWMEIANAQSWPHRYGAKSMTGMRGHLLLSPEVCQLARSGILAFLSVWRLCQKCIIVEQWCGTQQVVRTCAPLFLPLSWLHLCSRGCGGCGSVSLEGITQEDQIFLLEGTYLEDEAIPGHYGVEALTTLEVAGAMLGGKVCGSLACAGKVRGQTPKVAKQEKQKKTGQAKWWMQYNQQFVNVVPTFGKKNWPSDNS